MNVTVVGAGIVGSCVAHRLAVAGANVTLIEQGTPGAVASATSYAWLNSNNVNNPEYHSLRCVGMSAYPELAKELGSSHWLHQDGNLHVEYTEERAEKLRAKVSRLRGTGYPARLIDQAELRRLEPALRPASAVTAAAVFPAEGSIDSTPLIAELLAAFRQAGGTFVSARVASLAMEERRAVGAVLTGGEVIAADTVVLCAGSASDLLAGAGVRLSLRGGIGASVITRPAPIRVFGLVHLPDLSIRSDGNGRLVIRATDIDDMVDTESMRLPDAAVAEVLRRASLALDVPGDGLAVDEVRVAFRPRPPDGLPIVGPVDAVPGVYLVSTHSGITIGALLGSLVTQEVVLGQEEPMLAPFRSSRVLTEQTDQFEAEWA